MSMAVSEKRAELLRVKECLDKSEACKCEYQIKQLTRNEKLDWFRE